MSKLVDGKPGRNRTSDEAQQNGEGKSLNIPTVSARLPSDRSPTQTISCYPRVPSQRGKTVPGDIFSGFGAPPAPPVATSGAKGDDDIFAGFGAPQAPPVAAPGATGDDDIFAGFGAPPAPPVATSGTKGDDDIFAGFGAPQAPPVAASGATGDDDIFAGFDTRAGRDKEGPGFERLEERVGTHGTFRGRAPGGPSKIGAEKEESPLLSGPLHQLRNIDHNFLVQDKWMLSSSSSSMAVPLDGLIQSLEGTLVDLKGVCENNRNTHNVEQLGAVLLEPLFELRDYDAVANETLAQCMLRFTVEMYCFVKAFDVLYGLAPDKPPVVSPVVLSCFFLLLEYHTFK